MTTTLLLDAHLKRLRLPTVAKLYPKLARDAESGSITYERFLLALFEAEVAARDANMLKERVKAAKFPFAKDFDEFDFAAIPSLNKAKLLHLAEGEYLARRENVLLVGTQGTGKTHLAIALGRAACRQGKRVQFTTAAGLANDLAEAQAAYRLSRLEAALAKVDLLIIDELGYVPFNTTSAQLLFGAISARYERGSVIVTSNKEFGKWTEVFGDPALTGALLDRLTHHAHIFSVNGESFRFKQSLSRSEKKRPE